MRVKLEKGRIDLPKLLPQLLEVAACWEELVALWLFGSYAEQFQTPLSDLDVAYLLQDGLPDVRVRRVDREI
jgi:predicted nucleotidyltransferase